MWTAHKVCRHPEMGYALFVWNHEAQMWQQCTKWYAKLGNLKRHAKNKLGINIA